MATITKDMISKPPLWRLALELRPSSLEVVLSHAFEELPIIYKSLTFDAALDPLKAFEEAIYENPVLLSDFAETYLLISTPRFTIIPSDVNSSEVHQDIIDTIWTDLHLTPLNCSMPLTDESLLMALDPSVLAFMRRTFIDTVPTHPLCVLCKYFQPQSTNGCSSKIYVHCKGSYDIDVLAFDNGKLMLANAFTCSSANDAAYYTLAAAQAVGMQLDDTEILMCGHTEPRQELTPLLRDLVKRVMPAIFPSDALRGGSQVMQAPFPLILAPIVE